MIQASIKVLLMAAGLVSAGRAAHWYIDTAGQGSGNGTSWGNARAFGSMGSLNLQAGDTVNISGGAAGQTKTYVVQNWQPKQGTAISPITYRIGQDAGHNGRARFQGSGGYFLSVGSIKNIIISGDAGDGARHFAAAGYSGILFALDFQVVSNVRIGYIDFGTIASVTSQKGQRCLSYIKEARKFEFDHNYIRVTDHNMTIMMYAIFKDTGWDGSRVHHNEVIIPSNRCGLGADGFQFQGNGISFYHNNLSTWKASATSSEHQDGVQFFRGHYVKIYGNRIINMANYPIFCSGWSGSYDHLYIYNNIVIIDDPNLSHGTYCHPQGIAVGYGQGSSFAGAGQFNDVIIANNIIDGFGSNRAISYGCSNIYGYGGCDNTSFTNSMIANNIVINGVQGIALLKGAEATPTPTNAFLSVAQARQNFVRYQENSSTNDYHLLANAPNLVGKGTDLSAHFTTDRDGIARPQDTAWDIGAYEYTDQAAVTMPENYPVSPVCLRSLKAAIEDPDTRVYDMTGKQVIGLDFYRPGVFFIQDSDQAPLRKALKIK